MFLNCVVFGCHKQIRLHWRAADGNRVLGRLAGIVDSLHGVLRARDLLLTVCLFANERQLNNNNNKKTTITPQTVLDVDHLINLNMDDRRAHRLGDQVISLDLGC